jgi:predicted secreted Zn-dependent protease
MRIISFFLILGLLTQIAIAEVIESLDYQYYDVSIAVNQSLLFALNQSSPIKQDGKEHHGYTKWDVRWNYRWNSDNNGMCRIISSTTTLRGTILLPRLKSANNTQRSQFDSYVTALLEHEQGHYQIGKDAAKAIDEQILSLPAASDCRSLENAANGGAYQTLEEYKKTEREYDTKTMHGKTQGAWLAN